MENLNIVCQTNRLTLRHFTMDDLGSLVALHCDPEVSRFLGGVKTPEQSRLRLLEWIAEYDQYGFSKWAVMLRSTGEFIGRCGLSLEEFDGVSDWELGWTLARAHWGQGYATEAAAAAMNHSFNKLGLQRLISLIRPGNFASIRVAERLGMTYQRMVDWKGVQAHMYLASAPPRVISPTSM